MTTMFASLRYRPYRLWFAGALLANVGTWMQRVAQDWLVYTDLSAESGIAIGVVTALQFLPALVLGPYAGLLADRLPRRGLLMVTQALMGLLALGLGLLVLLGTATLWHVWLFALGLGIVSALDNPVRQTFVAELVPNDTLPNAVALNSASFNAARLIGPAVAGLAIAAMGAGWVFIVNAVSFLFTILALTLMRQGDLFQVPHAVRGKGQLREGWAYLRGRSDLVLILVVIGVASAFGLNFQMTSAMMARSEFGQGAADYGILGSILAIGSLVGALLTARLGRPRVRRILVAALAFGVASGVMALAPLLDLRRRHDPGRLLHAHDADLGQHVHADLGGPGDAGPGHGLLPHGAARLDPGRLTPGGMDRGGARPALEHRRGGDPHRRRRAGRHGVGTAALGRRAALRPGAARRTQRFQVTSAADRVAADETAHAA